jgi:hypothetical protein
MTEEGINSPSIIQTYPRISGHWQSQDTNGELMSILHAQLQFRVLLELELEAGTRPSSFKI